MKDLISKLEGFGISLELVDENLKLSLPRTLERPELIEEVRQYKQELIAYLKTQKDKGSGREIEAYPTQEHYELSTAQQRLYFQWEMNKGSTAYNMANFVWLEGVFEQNQVTSAFNELIKRHEALRTNFIQLEEGLKQKVNPGFQIKLEYFKTQIEQVPTIASSFVRAFDLSNGPLIRVGLINLVLATADEHEKSLLMVDTHHIISDGISHQVLIKEIKQIYLGQELQPLRLQYKDFSLWQHDPARADEIERHKSYWIQHFEGPVPVLSLPTDFSRPADQNYDGGQYIFSVGSGQFVKLKKLGGEAESTFFSLILAIINVWLMKLSGQEDIVVGCPTSGRNHVDLEEVIGPCLNTVAIRNYPKAEVSIINFLKEVRETVYNALDHQDYPFEELVQQLKVDRDFSRNPVFDILLKAEERGGKLAITKPQPTDLGLAYTSKFDITVEAIQYDDNIELTLIYKRSLFRNETIKQFGKYLQNIIVNITENPAVSLGEVSALDPKVRESIGAEYSRNIDAHDSLKNLQTMLHESMVQHVSKVAIDYGDRKVTYSQLEDLAGKIGQALSNEAVETGAYIGILCEDRVFLIASMLAILDARCIFIPFNTTFPVQRNVSQLEQSDTRYVITDMSAAALTGYESDFDGSWLKRDEILNLDQKEIFVRNDYSPEDPAYVYFTSGSTGKPKGIIGRTKGVAHFIRWEIDRCQVDSSFRVSQLTPPTFDPFLRDVFVAFCTGATLCIPEEETAYMLDRLAKWIDDQQITLIHCVPSVFRLLIIDSENVLFENLDHILLSGEAINPLDLQQWYVNHGEKSIIYNLYGSTETTMVKSCFEISPSDTTRSTIPIGKPMDNTQFLILDKSMRSCPQLVPGEIYIRTPYRSLGYLEEGFNKLSFISNPFSQDESDLLYKTGDFGRLLADGNFEFLGRADNQIKLNGNRIELNEISSCIWSFDDITGSVVVIKSGSNDTPVVCAYYVSEQTIDTEALRSHVQLELPNYMVPSFFCQLDTIPLNANGKVNREALPEPVFESSSDYKAPVSFSEKALVRVWSEVLGIDQIGITDNFFAIGGDSIKSMKIIARLRNEGYELTIKDIFQAQIIERLALRLTKGENTYSRIMKAELREYYPLSSAQKRQFLLHELSPDPLVSNMSNRMELDKEYDFHFLSDIFQQLVDRHESLRTSFQMVNDVPVQVVHDHIDFKLERISSEEHLQENFRFSKRFDLKTPPFFRAGFVESDDHNILLIDIHHSISDGISNLLLKEELDKLLLSEPLPPSVLQYRDFATRQYHMLENGYIDESKAYWLRLFDGKLPVPPFRDVGGNQNLEGSSITFHLGRQSTDNLKKKCGELGTSIFPVILALHSVVFQKLTSNEDLVIGFPSTGRSHLDTEKVIGVFINTLALRLAPTPKKRFTDFVEEVGQHITDALDHQEYPFDELVEHLDLPRSGTQNPLFSILMVMQNHLDLSHVSIENGEEPGELWRVDQEQIVNDLFIRCAETANDIVLNYQYNRNRLAPEDIENLFSYVQEILAQLMREPASSIEQLKLSPVFQKALEKVLDDDFDF